MSQAQALSLTYITEYRRVVLTNSRFCGSTQWDRRKATGEWKRARTSTVIFQFSDDHGDIQDWAAEVQCYFSCAVEPTTVFAAVKWLGQLCPLQRDHVLNVVDATTASKCRDKVDNMLASQIKRLICVMDLRSSRGGMKKVVIEVPSFAEF